jgi:hypothetical protein
MQFIQKRSYFRIWPAVLILVFLFAVFPAEKASGVESQAAPPSHYFTATYFHGSVRCPTCHRIETLSHDAIINHFADELKTGTLVWRAVNVEEPENRHFNTDYQLYTKSLIISEIRDGKEIRWKNLEKVWQFVRNEEDFDRYISSEIKT